MKQKKLIKRKFVYNDRDVIAMREYPFMFTADAYQIVLVYFVGVYHSFFRVSNY